MKWTAVILTVIMMTALLTGYIMPQDSLQQDLSGKLLRFHCIANSDDPQDQQLKLKVKDAVTGYLSGCLAGADSKEDAGRIISGRLDEISSRAQEVIRREGYDYPVTVAMGRYEFPVKSYGDITLPAGDYDALRVVIGEGKGKNWWCVMFPPLCFIDVAHGQADAKTKEELSKVLTDKEIEQISTDKPQIRLKGVEIIENIASKVTDTFKLAFQKKALD